MPVSGGGSGGGSAGGGVSEVESVVNASASDETDVMDIDGASGLGVYVSAISGAHDVHEVTVYISPNGDDWFETDYAITGIGNLHKITCVSMFAKCKITTAEGAPSTVKINMISR